MSRDMDCLQSNDESGDSPFRDLMQGFSSQMSIRRAPLPPPLVFDRPPPAISTPASGIPPGFASSPMYQQASSTPEVQSAGYWSSASIAGSPSENSPGNRSMDIFDLSMERLRFDDDRPPGGALIQPVLDERRPRVPWSPTPFTPLSRMSPASFLNRSRMLPSQPRFKFEYCTFCENNNEDENFYRSHTLKDDQGMITCPVLYNYQCPVCFAKGPVAHTLKYCPVNKAQGHLSSLMPLSLLRSMRPPGSTRRSSWSQPQPWTLSQRLQQRSSMMGRDSLGRYPVDQNSGPGGPQALPPPPMSAPPFDQGSAPIMERFFPGPFPENVDRHR